MSRLIQPTEILDFESESSGFMACCLPNRNRTEIFCYGQAEVIDEPNSVVRIHSPGVTEPSIVQLGVCCSNQVTLRFAITSEHHRLFGVYWYYHLQDGNETFEVDSSGGIFDVVIDTSAEDHCDRRIYIESFGGYPTGEGIEVQMSVIFG